MAASASRIRSAASACGSVAIAMPMLPPMNAVAVLERERLGERLEQPLGDGDRVVGPGDVLAHEHELVAAEAGGHLVAADGGAQALGDGEQQAVAGVVAEAVVDDLEAVEVDEQHGDAAAAALDAGERALQAAHQQQAARQAGERVAQELLLVRPPRGDVGEARGEDEAAVDQRPAPRVRGGLRVGCRPSAAARTPMTPWCRTT